MDAALQGSALCGRFATTPTLLPRFVAAWLGTTPGAPLRVRAAQLIDILSSESSLTVEHVLAYCEHLELTMPGVLRPLAKPSTATSAATSTAPTCMLDPPGTCPFDGDGKAHVLGECTPVGPPVRCYGMRGVRLCSFRTAKCSCGVILHPSTYHDPQSAEDHYYADAHELPIFVGTLESAFDKDMLAWSTALCERKQVGFEAMADAYAAVLDAEDLPGAAQSGMRHFDYRSLESVLLKHWLLSKVAEYGVVASVDGEPIPRQEGVPGFSGARALRPLPRELGRHCLEETLLRYLPCLQAAQTARWATRHREVRPSAGVGRMQPRILILALALTPNPYPSQVCPRCIAGEECTSVAVDLDAKIARDVCICRSGNIIPVPGQGMVAIGCIETPAFKSDVCPTHAERLVMAQSRSGAKAAPTEVAAQEAEAAEAVKAAPTEVAAQAAEAVKAAPTEVAAQAAGAVKAAPAEEAQAAAELEQLCDALGFVRPPPSQPAPPDEDVMLAGQPAEFLAAALSPADDAMVAEGLANDELVATIEASEAEAAMAAQPGWNLQFRCRFCRNNSKRSAASRCANRGCPSLSAPRLADPTTEEHEKVKEHEALQGHWLGAAAAAEAQLQLSHDRPLNEWSKRGRTLELARAAVAKIATSDQPPRRTAVARQRDGACSLLGQKATELDNEELDQVLSGPGRRAQSLEEDGDAEDGGEVGADESDTAKGVYGLTLKKGFYLANALVDHKSVLGTFVYRVRWDGYTPKEDTWELQDNILGGASGSLVTEYWARCAAATRVRPAARVLIPPRPARRNPGAPAKAVAPSASVFTTMELGTDAKAVVDRELERIQCNTYKCVPAAAAPLRQRVLTLASPGRYKQPGTPAGGHLRRTKGVIMAVRSCNLIVGYGECYGSESLSQVCHFLLVLFNNSPGLLQDLKVLAYDDMCHLRRCAANPGLQPCLLAAVPTVPSRARSFLELRRNAHPVYEKLLGLVLTVDGLHIKNHWLGVIDSKGNKVTGKRPKDASKLTYCGRLCDPRVEPNLSAVMDENTMAAEQTFRWLSLFKVRARPLDPPTATPTHSRPTHI